MARLRRLREKAIRGFARVWMVPTFAADAANCPETVNQRLILFWQSFFQPPPVTGRWSSSMTDIMSILQSSYSTASSSLMATGAKFANVDPTKYQGTWTGVDSNKKPITITISNVSGYRANVKFQSADGGLQTQRVFIDTNGRFRLGTSQMQLTAAGKITVSTVITDPTTGNQSLETDHVTLQGSSNSTSSTSTTSTPSSGIIA
jgi:hypothetical protein